MELSVRIDPAQDLRVLQAFASVYKYQAQVPDGDGTFGPNPETLDAFARRFVRNYVLDVVRSAEAVTAAKAAQRAAIDTVNTEVVLT